MKETIVTLFVEEGFSKPQQQTMEFIHYSETINQEHRHKDSQPKPGISTYTTEKNPLEKNKEHPNPNIINQTTSIEKTEVDIPTPAGVSETVPENGNLLNV
ncbi:hypothetical protein DPMN_038970 [Dreissena polymorpha]|uniref:Uncharacterized protein n=1 Tax=Dreissena polymorpha TaxID=45954 RepID=A0A9D4MGG5_DREPO|nr:hypothetical protein DPMN_038970 [Dreissena polymorpha]